ncbi:MAG: pyridoxal-phosphate dependent enzyme [Crenarchaeota archaeon]|nr:pyridoxal-phosphate dependent enzyme [Thermoproteota archaeon]
MQGYKVSCIRCGAAAQSVLSYSCVYCGGILDVSIDVEFRPELIVGNDTSIWRYRAFYPYIREGDIITLGEGFTPIVRFKNGLFLKLDYLNPTGSFKDRGSSVLISAIRRFVDSNTFIAEDSSGNAGASIAAYAALAGIKAKIYVPETVSGLKLEQIRAYGAEVIKVKGGRTKASEEAIKAEPNKVYIGHIYHPIFRDGMRTIAYELYEQLGGKVPSAVFVPVSAGTLLLGLIKGFEHLLGSGLIDEIPLIVACQTRIVSPLYHAFKGLKYTPPKKVKTVADALVSTNPPLLELMVRKLREINGDAIIVDEEEILEAYWELASRGIFVEPSSAVAYAASKKYESIQGPKIVILTGFGLKTRIYQRSRV